MKNTFFKPHFRITCRIFNFY